VDSDNIAYIHHVAPGDGEIRERAGEAGGQRQLEPTLGLLSFLRLGRGVGDEIEVPAARNLRSLRRGLVEKPVAAG
jgi:hypothetical protein